MHSRPRNRFHPAAFDGYGWPMSTTKTQISPRMIVGCSVGIGLAVGIVPAILLWANREDYPDRVAVHWGADGRADGWMSLGASLLSATIFISLLTLFMIGLGAVVKSLAIMAPITVGMAMAMAWTIYGATLAQAGGDAPDVGPFLFSGVVVWAVVGALGYLWLRGRLPMVPAAETGTFMPSAPGHPEIRRWQGSTRVGNGIWVAAGVLVLVGVVLAAVIGVRDAWFAAALLLLTVALAPLMLLSLQEITIDERGVTGTWFGIRVTRIPLDELRSAGHLHVEALGDYGGVGFRTAVDGRREGLVTSTGEALILEREGRKDYVITVDDAPAAARVLAMFIGERVT